MAVDFRSALEDYRRKVDLNNANESRWLLRCLELAHYGKLHGHVNVPAKYPNNKSLGYWVRKQRYSHSLNKLDPDRQQLLELLGFNFRLLANRDWDKMYRMLRKELEHLAIRDIQPLTHPQLHSWVQYQRSLYWKGKLKADRLKSLKEAGVDMTHRTLFRFEHNLEKLKAFQRKNEHCYVCKSYGADKQLINFVKGLRRTKNELPADTKSLLDELGFVWEAKREVTQVLNRERGKRAWFKRYGELYRFQKEFGHCQILTTDPDRKSLANWASVQRNNLKGLSKQQIALLNDIGFFKDNVVKPN